MTGAAGDHGSASPPDPSSVTLHEAADRLGVHYMTVYRWVRLGILPAEKVNGSWAVDPADLDRSARPAAAHGRRAADGPRRVAAWRDRLAAQMLRGDVTGSWGVVEAAMASGLESSDIYVEVLAPTLHEIGASWSDGGVQIEQEHLASGVATAIIGRLGPRFVRRGRKKGAIILAMPPGERHGLGVAMLADILTGDRFEVRNLGPDTPAAALTAAMRDTDRLAAVVISVVDSRRRSAAEDLLAAARREDPSVPRLVGGHAVPDERAALEMGADGWAADPRRLADLIDALGSRRRRPSGVPRTSGPAGSEPAG